MTATASRELSKEELLEHWQSETESAFLYGKLVPKMNTEESRKALERLVRDETAHQQVFEKLLGTTPTFRPSVRIRGLLFVANLLGPKLVLSLLRLEEGREVARFLREAKTGNTPVWLPRLARESAEHAQLLGRLTGTRGDPWHHNESGGMVRNVVYGFNDGLTANFGLIAGMIGGAVTRDVVLLSGLSGLVAASFSMGSSGYLAAQSQREVDDNERNTQRAELLLWPEREEAYLATLYQEKGLPESEARTAAGRVMDDPEVALRELAKEKLGLTGEGESPLKEGLITGSATLVGALVPLVPFFFTGGVVAITVSFIISMAAHFLVGAARSTFTGRGWFRSGFDMFVVGLGIAVLGYVVGYLLTGILPSG
jgi:vacuolar iron transporter family protein